MTGERKRRRRGEGRFGGKQIGKEGGDRDGGMVREGGREMEGEGGRGRGRVGGKRERAKCTSEFQKTWREPFL